MHSRSCQNLLAPVVIHGAPFLAGASIGAAKVSRRASTLAGRAGAAAAPEARKPLAEDPAARRRASDRAVHVIYGTLPGFRRASDLRSTGQPPCAQPVPAKRAAQANMAAWKDTSTYFLPVILPDFNAAFGKDPEVRVFGGGAGTLAVPERVTAHAPRLPVSHLESNSEEDARVVGREFLVRTCALQRTPGGGIAAWSVQHTAADQQPSEALYADRFLNGIVANDTTFLLWDGEDGIRVAPAGSFVSVELAERAGVYTLQNSLLESPDLDPRLRQCLTSDGSLPADLVPRLLEFLDTHREVAGMDHSALPPGALEQASTLLVSSRAATAGPSAGAEPPQGG